MLGYVLPEKSELKLREYEIYSGYYCGICKYIGRRYGQLPRMSLSYDAAFLSLLLTCMDEKPDEPSREHCIAHHIRYRPVISNDAVDYAGDVMLILAWFKLLDDARDEGRFYAKAMSAFMKHHYNALSKRYPDLCDSIQTHIEELGELEKQKCSSIDRAAEAFSQIMHSIFMEGAQTLYPEASDEIHRRFSRIGYHMGKWIYLIDAADDIEENLRSGSYNPLIYRFGYDGEKESTDEFRKRIDEDLRFNLFSYLSVVADEVDTLDIKKNSGIIENIVYFGMNRRTEEVLKRLPPPNRSDLTSGRIRV